MILEALQLALALLFLVLLPGLVLSYALFPRPEDLGFGERAYVALAGGVLLVMAIAIVLGFLPHGSRGALQSFALKGMPNVELAVGGASLGLFAVAARRGAFPRLAGVLPTGWRPAASRPPRAQAPR